MLPDYKMIAHRFENDITIIPVFDVHYGAKEHMADVWESFLEKVRNTPDVYLVLGGDLIQNSTRSSVSNIFDDTMRPSEQKKAMAKMLEPVRDRILCSVTGNHERRSTKDADSDPSFDIMVKLDLEELHRENMAFLKIQMGKQERDSGGRTSGKMRPVYSMVVTHGSGGGIYTGTAVLKAERFGYVIDGLDVLVVGHSHKPFTTQPGKLKIDLRNNKVSVAPFKVITATSWLEYAGYAAQKLYLPTTYCLHTIKLSSNKKDIVVTM